MTTRRLLVQTFVDADDATCNGCTHCDRGNDRCNLFWVTLEADWSSPDAGGQVYSRHAECLEAERRGQGKPEEPGT
jgi:hypothetical protein